MNAWKTHVVACLVIAVMAAGAWTGSTLLADKGPKPASSDKSSTKIAEKFDHQGRITEIAADGKTLTLEAAPAKKGEPAQTVTVKLAPRAAVQYSWVGPDGAHPTLGYQALVRLASGSKDTAERVVFVGAEHLKGRPAQIAARVASVSQDGKSITVQLPPKMKGDTGEDRTIQLPPAEDVTFFGVAAGQARPAADYHAVVWLKKDSKGGDQAERVAFYGSAAKGKGQAGPDHAGRVTAIAADGKSLTLEVPGKTKGEAPKQVPIKLDARAEVLFDDVRAGEAKPAVGQRASVWLASGSGDTASKVRFAAVPAFSKGPSLAGTLESVSADGKTFHLQLHGKKKGDVEKKEQSVQLSPKGRLVYQAVGPNGAKPTKGYQAQVWLAEGSKDQAVLVVLQGPKD